MSQIRSILILACLVVLTEAALAQSSLNSSSLKLSDPSASTPTLVKSQNIFSVEQSEYISYRLPEYRPGAAGENSSVSLRLDEQIEKNGLIGKLKGKDEWSSTEHWNYGDVFEFYGGLKSENTQLSVGRKLDTWSTWDSQWQQGMFQPRYMENGVRPEAAGLTGVFANAHGENFSATLAYLPIFIPDFGAHFSNDNNRFVSKNPWFHPPNDQFLLGSNIGDINYSLNHPGTESIVKHQGGAAKFEYHDKNYSARLSGAYKPMPQFVLGFPSEHKFQSGPQTDAMNIEVNLKVVYDRVINLDNMYTSGRWTFSGSVAYDYPDDNGGLSDWTTQQIRPAEIVAGSIERRLEDAGPRSASVEIGFLKVNGGDAADQGTFASKDTLFTRRFQYYEAYSLGLKKEFRSLFHNPLETGLRVIYDRKQGGGVITFNTGMELTQGLHAQIQADFLGLLTSTADITDGFISEYRANDRLSLGMSYVF